MSISVTTDKFLARYMEFGTFYGFFKVGFINSQNIKGKLSKKDSKFVKMFGETVNVQTGHFETMVSS